MTVSATDRADRALPSWNVRIAGAIALVATIVIVGWSAAESGNTELSIPEAILLGVVEGLTEYLPVSSTGHLTVTQEMLGLTATPEAEAAADAYAIAIQAGAILAVLGIYRERILNTINAVLGRTAEPQSGRNLALALIGGFIPAAIMGLLLEDTIKENLFSIWAVVAAWFVGGVALLFWRTPEGGRPLESITLRDGVVIGFMQSIALWPGVSRSLVTILGALLVGISLAGAVEFAFLLGLITLGAATAYETLNSGSLIVEQFGLAAPLVGFVAALISAAAAVYWMVSYLQSHGLRIFGWYRIAIALIVGGLAVGGVVG